MGINKRKAGRLSMKLTQQRQKMIGMDNKDSVGKFLQASPPSTQSLYSTQIMTADPFRITVKNPATESGQFLNPPEKFKLQLFPIDEVTRRVLLELNHNPYLELTLRPRKKISSVVKHLNLKWGISRKKSSELVLFPYEGQTKNLVDQNKWTLKDTGTSAADVFIAVGQPEVFRLRYGWFPDPETEPSLPPFTSEDNLQSEDEYIEANEEKQPRPLVTQEIGHEEKQPCPLAVETVNSSSCKLEPSDESVKIVVHPSTLFVPEHIFHFVFFVLLRLLKMTFCAKMFGINMNKQNVGVGSSALLSWVDCVTNISMGQLLSETPDANLSNLLPSERNPSVKQISLNCDSFDAAIADLIAQNQGSHSSTQALHSSIWEAEETRHAFPIQEVSSSRNGDAPTSCCQSPTQDCASQEPDTNLKPDSQVDTRQVPANSQPESQVLHNEMSSLGLSNLCWGDSLGPFEFGVSSKHVSGCDSISLSGLIGNSLDVFQNCSIFGMEKAPST